MTLPDSVDTLITADLVAVERRLVDTAQSLRRPLADLVQAQIHETAPYVPAAFVIAAAWMPDASEQDIRRRRNLAVALQMLAIALRIHSLLVVQSVRSVEPVEGQGTSSADVSFLGSTILAGDYCFSRAAKFAAKTDIPAVVTIFSQALQTISEGQLRALFDDTFDLHNNTQNLLQFGITAALELSNLQYADRAKVLAVGNRLAVQVNDPGAVARLRGPLTTVVAQADLPTAQAAAWNALILWLTTGADNGQGLSN